MKRFENAQIGDLVYCRLHGNGIVVDPNHTPSYASVCVSFGSGFRSIYYHIDGRLTDEAAEATLFYRKDKEKYLTERPESEVDWSKVPAGTQVLPWDDKEPRTDDNENYHEAFMAYLPHLEYPFWVYYENNGRKDYSRGFKYCKLAEPCKPEWRK